MEQREIVELVHTVVPDAQVIPEGEDCSFSITVVSDTFAGMARLKRQQTVLAAFNELITSGTLHALNIKAVTQEEWAKLNVKPELMQINL